MSAKKMKAAKLAPRKFVPRPKVIPPAPVAESAEKEKSKRAYQLLRGMRDVLPKEERYWKKISRIAEQLAEYYQFGRIETPVLEEANLFVRSVGRGTDIVDKEMYVFEDRDGTRVALRPEGTAGVARAYLSSGLWNAVQPVKVWYFEAMFRHDRPQAGRYREHYQVGFETLGAKDAAMDAELILVAYNFYQELGLPVEIRVNSLGMPEERERYVTELTSYYRGKRSYLCEDCRNRLVKNPLRLLDCKAEQCQPIKEAAPQIIDWLSEESKKYFMSVLEYLEELAIPYILSPTLVRGFDYYTHTLFEVYPAFGEAESSQTALGGGGRYDLLVEELGGKPTPAAGFGLGVERAIAALKEYAKLQNAEPVAEKKFEVFFAHLGADGKRRALHIINDLRASGIILTYNFFKNSLKSQLELANTLKVPYVLMLGQKEVQDKTIIIRDMESGVQEIVDQKKLEATIKKKLGR